MTHGISAGRPSACEYWVTCWVVRKSHRARTMIAVEFKVEIGSSTGHQFLVVISIYYNSMIYLVSSLALHGKPRNLPRRAEWLRHQGRIGGDARSSVSRVSMPLAVRKISVDHDCCDLLACSLASRCSGVGFTLASSTLKGPSRESTATVGSPSLPRVRGVRSTVSGRNVPRHPSP